MAGKRSHGEGTIFKRERDGRWVAQLTLANGRRKTFTAATQAEARARLNAARRDRDAGFAVADDRLTVARYLESWLETAAAPTLRPRTLQSYRMQVRVHIAPALGRIRLTRLAPADVQRMMNDMSAAGLAPASVLYTRAVLRKALGQAMKWGLVQRNVAALVDPPRQSRPPVPAISPDDARALLTAFAGHPLESHVTVALATGIRQGELLGLCWSDVDLDGATLTVRHALQRVDGMWNLAEPKTKRSRRTLALPAFVVAALRQRRAIQGRERLLAGDRWHASDLVFTTSIGTPMDGCNVTHRFQHRLAEAGLHRMRWHDLRHGCASLLVARDAHPRVIMEQLGHSTIAVTMNTYAHVLPAALRDAADRMDSLIGGLRDDATL